MYVCFNFFFFWHFVRLGRADTESHFPVAILPRSFFLVQKTTRGADQQNAVCVCGWHSKREWSARCNITYIWLYVLCRFKWPFGIHSCFLLNFHLQFVFFFYRHRWRDGFLVTVLFATTVWCFILYVILTKFANWFYFLSSIRFLFLSVNFCCCCCCCCKLII